MIELYDVGRTLIKPFKQGYRFIAEEGHRYIDDKAALERIITFQKDRSTPLSQADFDILSDAWVEAIQNGELPVNKQEMIYPDVKPWFQKVKQIADEIYLLTSGSKDLVDLIMGEEYGYEKILSGSEVGDKNHPETYELLWQKYEGNIFAFFDDKPSVILAAYHGFNTAVNNPLSYPLLYLVDRKGVVSSEEAKDFKSKEIEVISSFEDIDF